MTYRQAVARALFLALADGPAMPRKPVKYDYSVVCQSVFKLYTRMMGD